LKARPRGAERSVAKHLSDIFVDLGLSPVERIPILGRTGPDLSSNELNLVIDVKSRKEVPATIFFPILGPFSFDQFFAVRLCCLSTLWDEGIHIAPLDFRSVLVTKYWEHMDEWRQEKNPQGVTALVLHRPTEPFGSALFIIHKSDYRRLYERCQILLNP
jgi:hypothetical protein